MQERSTVDEIYERDQEFYAQMEAKYNDSFGFHTGTLGQLVSVARTYQPTDYSQLYMRLTPPVKRQLEKMVEPKLGSAWGKLKKKVGRLLRPQPMDDQITRILTDVVVFVNNGVMPKDEGSPHIVLGDPVDAGYPSDLGAVAGALGANSDGPGSWGDKVGDAEGPGVESAGEALLAILQEMDTVVNAPEVDETLADNIITLAGLVQNLNSKILEVLDDFPEDLLISLKETIEKAKAKVGEFRTDQYNIISDDDDKDVHDKIISPLGLILTVLGSRIDEIQFKVDLTGRIKF